MRCDAGGRQRFSSASARTIDAVRRQADAIGSAAFEIGLFKPDASTGEAVMLTRVWDPESLMRSVAWLRHQNREGRNIYIRPRGEHDLSLIDDLNAEAVAAMKQAGFAPAAVIETSPGNYQAWVKHSARLSKELGTAAARKLAERFGGDPAAADWRHFGRLAGFTNRKDKYRDPLTGLHPFVRIVEATGAVYPEALAFVAGVRRELEAERDRERERRLRAEANSKHPGCSDELKSIDVFRADPRYGGDGTRIDLAYAIYAFSRGVAETQVEAALRSRDLSHKGGERRQADYVERTIRKAVASARADSLGR